MNDSHFSASSNAHVSHLFFCIKRIGEKVVSLRFDKKKVHYNMHYTVLIKWSKKKISIYFVNLIDLLRQSIMTLWSLNVNWKKRHIGESRIFNCLVYLSHQTFFSHFCVCMLIKILYIFFWYEYVENLKSAQQLHIYAHNLHSIIYVLI